jgi:hypothetical protein
MIIAEQLVLLALDPERGTFSHGINRKALARGACAAVLADLVLSRRVARRGRGIALLDNLPDFNPLLDAAGKALASSDTGIGDAIERIARKLGSIEGRLLASLVARDVVHHYRQAFVLHRYPVRSMQALRVVFDRLHEAARMPQPSPAAVAFAAIAERCGVLAARTTPDERTRIRQRINALRLDPDISVVDLSLVLEIGEYAALP